MKIKRVGIFGSTGSIGKQTLEVIDISPDLFSVEILTANNNATLLIEQALKYKPNMVVIANELKYEEVKEALKNTDIKVFAGTKSVEDVAKLDCYDIMVAGLVGIAGLIPTMHAIEQGKTIALANKETLVVAGDLIIKAANLNQSKIIPVDSEHAAIFQCLVGEMDYSINRVILTASGGPFLGKKIDFLKNVKAAQAIKNPNWEMGKKVSIDSSSLMNKGLEMIEAKWLFNLTPKQIDVIVHPQSIIHSMVEFTDGSIKAQLSNPDMRLPIQYALNFPFRGHNDFPKLQFNKLKELNFEEPDLKSFRNLELAIYAMNKGGNFPCILNAANEVVVEAFILDKVGFIEMSDIIEKTLLHFNHQIPSNLSSYFEIDKNARTFANSIIKN
ncbi:MAG: 1-deoxy-D-xylulose-5-phosphate reductoisomerase [Sediminibacterium sp.]|nr:1-deoxy-D-xylulose-5-phosphate reductoisomerase [Sediminibacterium sp.]